VAGQASGVLGQRSRVPRAASWLLRREAGVITRRPDEAPHVDEERTGGFLSKLLAALGLRRRTKSPDQAGKREREQATSVRPAPPATSTDRAGIAEGSPAGEKSGHEAVPGAAQDAGTSTVDQSRGWPYRDAAPRQDPAESQLDPIWGADPPDAVRWRMDVSAGEEAASAETQAGAANGRDAPSQPREDGTTEPADSTGSPLLGGTERAALPTEPHTAHEGLNPELSRPAHDAGSDVGWFSTGSRAGAPGAGLDDEGPAERLRAEHPGDEPPQNPDAGMPGSTPAQDDIEEDGPDRRDSTAAEGSKDREGAPGNEEAVDAEGPRAPERSAAVGSTVGSLKPLDGVGSPSSTIEPGAPRGPLGPEGPTGTGDAEAAASRASSGAEASVGTGSAPGRQDLHGPELIEASMAHEDPEPEIGPPPTAAGWTDRPAAESSPEVSLDDPAAVAAPAERGAGDAQGRDVVDSSGVGSGHAGEDDSPNMAVPAAADDEEAEAAADGPVPVASTDQATDPLPSNVPRSTQTGPEAPTEDPSGAFSSLSPLDAEDASMGDDESVRPGASGQDEGFEASGSRSGGPEVGTSQSAPVGEVAARPRDADEGEGVAWAGSAAQVGSAAGAGAGGAVGGAGAGAGGAGGAARAGGAGPADAAGASPDPTVAPTPWSEPALPMAWPPGMVPPVRGEAGRPLGDDAVDPEPAPEPDPTWPRLFGQGLEGDEGSGSGDPSSGRQATRGSHQELNREQRREEMAEPSYSQGQDTALGSGGGEARSSAVEPAVSAQATGVRGASRAASATDAPAGRSADESVAVPHGAWAVEPSDARPASADVAAGASAAPGGAAIQPTSHPSTVDGTTGESGNTGGPGPAAEAGGPTASAQGGVGTPGQANMATDLRAAGVGEVDLREGSARSRSGDVSRETSADGGEAMDPGRQDEALADEAAVAVRDAVSRAAAEAKVDVSRETEPLAADASIEEPNAEVVDSESAARNARVTFRIQHDTPNGIRRVLAVANQKGGVGKSTTAVNIGAYLALAGARVLVIDLDPQGNASTGLGLDHRDIEPSIYDVLMGEAPPAAAIRATGVPNLHVLPSTIDLAGAEVELVSAMSRETRLRRALQSVDHQYETILVDCPPSLGLLTVNALAAADQLLIPIQCEYYALEGLGQLLRNVELVRANLNPQLRIGGIVLTMYDGRTRLALQVVDEVRKHFTDLVYQTVVPRSVRLSEAPGYGLPIALYDPLSRGGIAYRDLTFELAERSGLLAPTGEGAS
jgi:chromosome partitioning protein